MPEFPSFIQYDANDCGPTCLKMIAQHYGRHFTLETLREKCFISHSGVSLLGISEAAESIGFRTEGVKLSFQQLQSDLILPCIVHWNQEHFVVVYKTTRNAVYIADPAFGLATYTVNEFLDCWTSTVEDDEKLGICLQLEPTPDFFSSENEKIDKGKIGFLFKYLHGYRSLIIQLFLGIILSAILQIILPFLFQALVDKGVIIPNPSLIVSILIAQLILVTSKFSVEFIRNWIILHLGSRINIYMVSDFLIKLMKLPVSFFDSKNRGDLIQRINDHKRIEIFLTQTTINLFYSGFSILIMGIVLAIFSFKIFIIFFLGTSLYLLWTSFFMKKRKELENRKFAQLSNHQNTLIQLLAGMHEIKLNNCEKQKRWEWENIQAKLFKINIKSLALFQKQKAGALVLNEFKDLLIIFYAANLVLKGQITLGSMVAISYVIGQLSGPLDNMITFFHSTQDAKISMERFGEIHNKTEEESNQKNLIFELKKEHYIKITDLSFQYEGPNSPYVLKKINLIIPQNKTTAIVGTSGSGKTTLLKLLLNFYSPVTGEILIGEQNLNTISPSYWRSICGVVLQDGYLFSDTIARNIALSDENVDKEKLYYAARIANVHQITDNLPLGFNTKIGQEGSGLSQGQKQRLLIARAIYKNPDFLLFDEATNALDANNEMVILNNLNEFFKGRTVIVVAHRLSTVRNADQIVVLEKGEIIEIGTHNELSKSKGAYYQLVKNQLELGV
jgi:ATP-binding cassette, subfamily B, bacterial